MKDRLVAVCVEAFSRKNVRLSELAERLMRVEGVPMHGPIHHFIVPAALLTVAAVRRGTGPELFRKHLELAWIRAEKVQPGFCGLWGCCGAAVGCGIFASAALDAAPKREENWSAINAFTARCLEAVASVGGPRCCKRVVWLALAAAEREAAGLLGLELRGADGRPMDVPVCTRSALNQECRKQGCPFYPC